MKKKGLNLKKITESLGNTTKSISNSYKKRNKLKNADNKTRERFYKIRRVRRKRLRAEKMLEMKQEALKVGKSAVKGGIKKAKGPLFPLLDFIVVIIGGWLFNHVPKWIKGIKNLIDKVKGIFKNVKGFFDGVVNFFTSIGSGIKEAWSTITGQNKEAKTDADKLKQKTKKLEDTFKEQKKGIDDILKQAQNGSVEKIKKNIEAVDKDKPIPEKEKKMPIVDTKPTSGLREYTKEGLNELVASGANSRRIEFYKKMLYHKKPHLRPVHATTDFAGNVLTKEQEAAALNDPHLQNAISASIQFKSTKTVTVSSVTKVQKGNTLTTTKRKKTITVPISVKGTNTNIPQSRVETPMLGKIVPSKNGLNSKDLLLTNIK